MDQAQKVTFYFEWSCGRSEEMRRLHRIASHAAQPAMQDTGKIVQRRSFYIDLILR
jgi:hypothetical protein